MIIAKARQPKIPIWCKWYLLFYGIYVPTDCPAPHGVGLDLGHEVFLYPLLFLFPAIALAMLLAVAKKTANQRYPVPMTFVLMYGGILFTVFYSAQVEQWASTGESMLMLILLTVLGIGSICYFFERYFVRLALSLSFLVAVLLIPNVIDFNDYSVVDDSNELKTNAESKLLYWNFSGVWFELENGDIAYFDRNSMFVTGSFDQNLFANDDRIVLTTNSEGVSIEKYYEKIPHTILPPDPLFKFNFFNKEISKFGLATLKNGQLITNSSPPNGGHLKAVLIGNKDDCGDEELFARLLELGGDPNYFWEEESQYLGFPPITVGLLSRAIGRDCRVAIESLLDHGVKTTHSSGYSALKHATRRGHFATVKLFLDNGENPLLHIKNGLVAALDLRATFGMLPSQSYKTIQPHILALLYSHAGLTKPFEQVIAEANDCNNVQPDIIGYRDGHSGFPIETFALRAESCAFPEKANEEYWNAWKNGRNEYCNFTRGVAEGRKGVAYYFVCESDSEDNFLNGYIPAFELFSIEKKITELNNELMDMPAVRGSVRSKEESDAQKNRQTIRYKLEKLEKLRQKVNQEILADRPDLFSPEMDTIIPDPQTIGDRPQLKSSSDE